MVPRAAGRTVPAAEHLVVEDANRLVVRLVDVPGFVAANLPNHYFERHSHQGSGNSLESCQRRCRLTGCRAISFAPGNCWLYGYACSSISLAAGVETYVPLDALAGTVAVNYELPARHFQLRRPTIKVRHWFKEGRGDRLKGGTSVLVRVCKCTRKHCVIR